MNRIFIKWPIAKNFVLVLFFLLAAGCSSKDAAQETEKENLGEITFPNSGSQEAQPYFERGVLALHSFWYPEALEAFKKARELDPKFAMAYWGEAMSYNQTFWQNQNKEAALETLTALGETPEDWLKAAKTDKEKLFLQSLDILYSDKTDKLERDIDYMNFMKNFHTAYPDDHEVSAFYALSILGILRNNQGNEKEKMQAAAIAQQILSENPKHPGAVHYLIHAVDDPTHAALGLNAARTYAEIAPEANHALHMPSHIFVQLGMWDDVIASNIDAYAASENWVKAKGLPADSKDHHSLSWLAYGLEQSGRFLEAAEKIKVIESNMAGQETDSRGYYYLPDMKARYTVESQDWKIIDFPTKANSSGSKSYTECIQLFALGLSAVHLENTEVAEQALLRIKAIRKINAAAKEAFYAKLIEVNENALAGLIAKVNNEANKCIAFFEKGVNVEESLNPPTGPPDVIKPIHELYGEVLLMMGQNEKALAQFEKSLERTPNRSLSVLGAARSARAMSNQVLAYSYYQAFMKNWKNADPDPVLEEARFFLDQHTDLDTEAQIVSVYPASSEKQAVQLVDQKLGITQCLPDQKVIN